MGALRLGGGHARTAEEEEEVAKQLEIVQPLKLAEVVQPLVLAEERSESSPPYCASSGWKRVWWLSPWVASSPIAIALAPGQCAGASHIGAGHVRTTE